MNKFYQLNLSYLNFSVVEGDAQCARQVACGVMQCSRGRGTRRTVARAEPVNARDAWMDVWNVIEDMRKHGDEKAVEQCNLEKR